VPGTGIRSHRPERVTRWNGKSPPIADASVSRRKLSHKCNADLCRGQVRSS
jgi:hypothetical protein